MHQGNERFTKHLFLICLILGCVASKQISTHSLSGDVRVNTAKSSELHVSSK